MAYDGKTVRRARKRFEADREERRRQLDTRREEVYRRQPRLREVDGKLHGTAGRILAAAMRRGTDPRPALEKLRSENLRLQREKRSLLEELHLPADFLDSSPACPRCRDSGYRDGRMCDCFRVYCAREQQRELSRMLDLGNQSFETFSLNWYSDVRDTANGDMSPRENMTKMLSECRKYARNFGKEGKNLLLCGAPGLGKTFLSAAIAREVSAAGFSVVYDTASHIFGQFEARKFSREEDADGDVSRVLNCDLLILDDLGTEMTTAFVRSTLYQIVNTRLMERKSTILNTNLNPDEIASRYSSQIASRIEGEYLIFPFFGDDIRRLKQEYDGHPPF